MLILNALRSMIVADNRSMYWTSVRGYSDSKKNLINVFCMIMNNHRIATRISAMGKKDKNGNFIESNMAYTILTINKQNNQPTNQPNYQPTNKA